MILTAPREEAQVDYGQGAMVRDPQTGKYRRTRLFVMTLGYSRKAVRLMIFRSGSRIWAELHEKAFRSLTGSLARIGDGRCELYSPKRIEVQRVPLPRRGYRILHPFVQASSPEWADRVPGRERS